MPSVTRDTSSRSSSNLDICRACLWTTRRGSCPSPSGNTRSNTLAAFSSAPIGFRSSWESIARNSSRRRACSRASASAAFRFSMFSRSCWLVASNSAAYRSRCCSARLRRVMSLAIQATATGAEAASDRRDMVKLMGNVLPDLRHRTVSTSRTCSDRRQRVRSLAVSLRASSGTRMVVFRPSSSSRCQPNTCIAAAFTSMMWPARSSMMIGSAASWKTLDISRSLFSVSFKTETSIRDSTTPPTPASDRYGRSRIRNDLS